MLTSIEKTDFETELSDDMRFALLCQTSWPSPLEDMPAAGLVGSYLSCIMSNQTNPRNDQGGPLDVIV